MLPICGPSYVLTTRKASVQRSVNLRLAAVEVPDKAQFILESAEGLGLFSDQSSTGACRGAIEVRGRAFQVVGNALLEIFSNGSAVSRGTIATTSGPVSMDYGLNQLALVDGSGGGYVLTLATNVLTTVVSTAFYGSVRVRYLDGFFLYIKADSRIFYISAFEDATTFDALDFASAEGGPDNLVSIEVSHSEVWLFCVLRTEVWSHTGGVDFPFSRNQGASIEVGCVAAQSVIRVDNSLFWIGRDSNGWGQVFRATGYTPQRVSNHAVEQAFQLSTDLTQATAWAYQEGGITGIAFNAPGLTSTWVFNVSPPSWYELCDLDAQGQFAAGRAINHIFAFGKHLVGSATGKIYQRSKTLYTNDTDPLVRERTTPHSVLPSRVRMFFKDFWLDCTTGEAGQGAQTYVELSWSKDSGATYSIPMLRSIGLVGERFARLFWGALGSARDRIWRIRFSGNAPFAIVDGNGDAVAGRS